MSHSAVKWLFGMVLSSITVTQLAAQNHKNITLNLQQVPLPVALQQLADYQQINLIVSAEVSGTVTLRLVDIPWQQALDTILQLHGLTKVVKGRLLLITRQQTLQKNPFHADHTEQLAVKPLETVYFRIHYAKAEELATLLQQQHPNGLLSTRGTLYVDKRTNRLLVRDEQERIAVIKHLISQFDQAAEQIQIEARIVTISNDDLTQLGIGWRLEGVATSEANGSASNYFFTTQLPVSNASGRCGLQIAKISGQLLDLELSALEQENRVEIIASPRLLTANRHTASIKQGSEIPYAVTRAKNATSVEFREAVLGLEATPYIAPNGRIVVDLKISQNTPGRLVKMAQGEAISIDKQEIRTQVTVTDGETVVLGGVFQRFGQHSRDRVPLLGQLPLIGTLFSRKTQQITKRELVIFITPRLLSKQCAHPIALGNGTTHAIPTGGG